MSNLGQAALIVVGTVVGAYFGNPQLGFVLGSLAGSALFPTQLPSGPRLSDNRTTTASVGTPVPIVFGTADVAGTVIWLAPFIEHSQTQGGKGGPEQKTFSYTQSIAIGLCERIDDTAADSVGAIAGVSRIWENGTIMYDIRAQLEADTALGTVAETDEDYANRLIASAEYAETFVLYLGDETQTADATMESIEGAGNVPAFRGLAYIVYPDRQLQLAQGQRHPSFTFEVYQSGIGDCVSDNLASNEVLYTWESSSRDPTNPANTNTYKVIDFDNQFGIWSGFNFAPIYPDLDSVKGVLTVPGGYESTLLTVGYTAAGSSEVVQSGGVAVTGVIGGTPDPSTVTLYMNFRLPSDGYFSDGQRFAGTIPVHDVALSVWHEGVGGTGEIKYNTGVLNGSGSFPPYTTGFVRAGIENKNGGIPPATWYETVHDAVVQITRSPAAPLDLCFGLTLSLSNPGYAETGDGRLIKCAEWTKVLDAGSSVKVLQHYQSDITKVKYPLNPCLLTGDPNYSNSTFWTDAYNAAVIAGSMTAGKVYGVDYPVTQGYSWQVARTICEGTGNQVPLSAIVESVCRRAGLTQVDVSDLTGILIPGYSVSGVCDAADIISPLRSVGFFDCIESGDVMKFPTRGKPVVATFDTNDFGCFDDGQTGNSGSSTVPPAVTTTRSDETTLPRSIRLHYKAVSRDYQDGEADSPFRLATTAVDDQDISIPVVLKDTQALQAAEIIWSDSWAAQNSHELSVDQSWSEIEPGDCIGVPIDGVIQRLRIVSDSNAAGILRKLTCVRDDEGAYISFAVAEPPQIEPQTLKLIAPSSAEFLDLPCLQDADSDPGFYVAAQRLNGAGNSWKGATVYKSIDGGATFTSVMSLITEATIGNLISALPVSEAHTWDNDTVIDVAVASSAFTFESRTDDAVLAGANAAAVGDDGRWEIVQFSNATKISDTHWQLSRLLRGRRGTEHNIGRSHINDRLVIISTGDVGRVVLQTTEIGASRIYKVVSIGTSYASGIDYPFAGHAEALVPFSPTSIEAVQETHDGILISWVRRSRLGRTLMSGVDIPLGETTESYQVDILDPASPDSPETVLRTLSSSTESVVYTGAQQTTDFGHTLPSGAIVRLAVYQLSSVVGRGTPAIVTLTVG